MGGAVSAGRDNDELIDNLMGGNYIRSRSVERVFRVLDRADYMTPESRDQAYKDLAWRNGPLHMSSPCIYSEVMEGLELRPGLSFLNVGSGTGYLSTLAGLILGSSGISHGIEVNPDVVEYANKKKSQFIENSSSLDEFDYCEPIFYTGNGLCLAPLQSFYDRVYCGAGCPEEYHNYFKHLIKIGGVLVLPLNENLLRVRRTGVTEWSTRTLLSVTFASLRVPSKEETADQIRLEDLKPARLQVLARGCIRGCVRGAVLRRRPELREPPPRAPPPRRSPRRITIPIQENIPHIDHYLDATDALHDIEDRAAGANEMNALLSLVLSMSHNRVAGALRFDPLSQSDSDSDMSDDDDDDRRDHRDDDDDRRDHRDDDDDRRDHRDDDDDRRDHRDDEDDRRDHRDDDDDRRDQRHDDDERPDQLDDKDDDGGGSGARDDRSDRNALLHCEDRSNGRGVITFEFQNVHDSDVDVRPTASTSAATDTDEATDDAGRRREDELPAVDSERENGDEEARPAGRAARAGDKRPRRAPSAERAAPRAAAPPPARRARRHRSLPDDALDDDSDEQDSSSGAGDGGEDQRRLALSLAMKRSVRELPLPPAMRSYLNYGRCFYF